MNHIHKNLLIKQKSISCVQEILYHITKYRPRPVDKGGYMNNSIFLVYGYIIPYKCNSVNTLWKTFFFAYCVSNFEHWFLFSRGLDNRAILSYNTTSAEEGQGSSLLFADRFYLTTCLSSLGMSLTTCVGWRVPSPFSMQSFSASEAIFECF